MKNVSKTLIFCVLSMGPYISYAFVPDTVITQDQELLQYLKLTLAKALVIENVNQYEKTISLNTAYQRELSNKFIKLKSNVTGSQKKQLDLYAIADNQIITSADLKIFKFTADNSLNLSELQVKPIGFYTVIVDNIEYSMLAVKIYGGKINQHQNFSFKIAARKLTDTDEMAN